MPWKVFAEGEDTGNVYVYVVHDFRFANEVDVACHAYAAHGRNYVLGRVPEYLSPTWAIEWEDDFSDDYDPAMGR